MGPGGRGGHTRAPAPSRQFGPLHLCIWLFYLDFDLMSKMVSRAITAAKHIPAKLLWLILSNSPYQSTSDGHPDMVHLNAISHACFRMLIVQYAAIPVSGNVAMNGGRVAFIALREARSAETHTLAGQIMRPSTKVRAPLTESLHGFVLGTALCQSHFSPKVRRNVWRRGGSSPLDSRQWARF